MPTELVGHVATWERRFASHQVVQRATQRVHIAPLRSRAGIACLFGRHVVYGSDRRAVASDAFVLIIGLQGQAKVDDLDGTVERVGDKVYLFAPANVAVEVDEGSTPSAAATSTRRSGFGDKRDS